jgi:hypothetical protein
MRYVDAGKDEEEPFKKRPFLFGVFCGLMVGLAAGMVIGFWWYLWYFGPPSATASGIIIPAASAQQQEQQEAGWLTYEDPLYRMKISYPENWTMGEHEKGVTLTSPDGNSDLVFTLGLDYSPGVGTAKSELRDFIDELKLGAILIEGVEFTVIEANSTTLGGWPAESATYLDVDSMPNDRPNTIVNTTSTQIVVVKDGTDVYRLDYSAPSSDWDRLLPTFEKMVDSVVIQ